MNISEILSNYITQRDKAVRERRSPLTSDTPKLSEIDRFTTMLDDFGRSLAHQIEGETGSLSLAQWEALHELAGVRLTQMRKAQ